MAEPVDKNPEVMGGRLVIHGRRILLATLLQRRREPLDVLAREWQLPEPLLVSALAWADAHDEELRADALSDAATHESEDVDLALAMMRFGMDEDDLRRAFDKRARAAWAQAQLVTKIGGWQ
jgi:uncharacterized protein (DUF433 family)